MAKKRIESPNNLEDITSFLQSIEKIGIKNEAYDQRDLFIKLKDDKRELVFENFTPGFARDLFFLLKPHMPISPKCPACGHNSHYVNRCHGETFNGFSCRCQVGK